VYATQPYTDGFVKRMDLDCAQLSNFDSVSENKAFFIGKLTRSLASGELPTGIKCGRKHDGCYQYRRKHRRCEKSVKLSYLSLSNL